MQRRGNVLENGTKYDETEVPLNERYSNGCDVYFLPLLSAHAPYDIQLFLI
jgi:hypothetical protein